jgi:secreted PhoX family phosphatase
VRLARRALLKGGGALAIGTALPPPLSFVFSRPAAAASLGPLVPDPLGLLDLPAGFAYRVLERQGDAMSDGYRVPGAPDGMACFAGAGNTLVLMRNHEVGLNDAGAGPYRPGQLPSRLAYDPTGHGGVTRLVLDATTLNRVSSNLVLAGTSRNCAGGVSPWGWLTCEEHFTATHGYVFVCPADAPAARSPQRIVGYGHFNHEAAVIDPATSICYLTEDRPDGCLYRFVPVSAARPFEGRLQALRVVGQDGYHTGASDLTVGQGLDVGWVDVMDPDPVADTVRAEARSRGAAVVARGEGLWHHQGSVYVCSTSGGPLGTGQIFQLVPNAGHTGGRLELIAQSADPNALDMPDNITIAPWGGLFMAEDGAGRNFVRGLDANGAVFDFARGPSSGSEFAGVCFAPGGQAMFVNLQRNGLTLAITGPFATAFGPPAAPSHLTAR